MVHRLNTDAITEAMCYMLNNFISAFETHVALIRGPR